METIKSFRLQKGVSQMKLSQLSGISRDRISKAECGYIKITRGETVKLRKAIANVSNKKK